MMRTGQAKPYTNPYVAGAILGVVLFATFFITGNGLGASGAISRAVVFLQDGVAPAHVDRTAYLSKMAGGNTNPLDNWIVMLSVGTLLGGLVSGLFHNRLKMEVLRGPQISPATRLVFAVVGGVLMGYGARMARGCTSSQAMSGGAVLSVGSWAFMLAIFAGGYALAWTVRKLWI